MDWWDILSNICCYAHTQSSTEPGIYRKGLKFHSSNIQYIYIYIQNINFIIVIYQNVTDINH